VLREVKDGRFEPVGLWPLRRWSFVAARVRSSRRLGRRRLGALLETQVEEPVALHDVGPRRYWIYGDRFWWDDDDLEPEDVRALAEERERRKRRQLERARAQLARDGARRPVRAPVPRALRQAVFERDGGRCVDCASAFDLQYDHAIPVVLGGATSLANLELRCGECNRRKGASL